MVNGCMNGIYLDSGGNVEACLLEPQRHAASASKQIDAYGPSNHSKTSISYAQVYPRL